jgi:hypothetical protein
MTSRIKDSAPTVDAAVMRLFPARPLQWWSAGAIVSARPGEDYAALIT